MPCLRPSPCWCLAGDGRVRSRGRTSRSEKKRAPSENVLPKRAMATPWLWRCRVQPRPSNIEEHHAVPGYAMAMGLSRSATCTFCPGIFATNRPTEGLCRPSTTDPAELSVSDDRHRTPFFSSELFSSELQSPSSRKRGPTVIRGRATRSLRTWFPRDRVLVRRQHGNRFLGRRNERRRGDAGHDSLRLRRAARGPWRGRRR